MPEALIWGASGGIGRALTELLKQNGWCVFAAARNESAIPERADFRYHFDAAQPETIKEAAILVAHETSGLDLVAYTAGGMQASKLEDTGADEWTAIVDANLTGAHLAIRSSLNLLKEGGHVMVMGAHVESITLPRFGAYTVAKAGLEPMMTILSKENRKLKFTLVKPGAVDTPFWDNVPFKLPNGAASPGDLAEAMLARYESGEVGALDL